MLHAHVWTESADCDGRYSSTYIARMDESELAESRKEENDFSEIHFTERVLGNIVSLTTLRDGQKGSLEVTEHGFAWGRPTDEGFESATVQWCHDETCSDSHTYRDHSAERAGY